MPRKLVYLALIALTILHQDFWLWDDPTLILGFVPVGLAYHAAYSVVVAAAWYLALKYAWPDDALRFARASDPSPESRE